MSRSSYALIGFDAQPLASPICRSDEEVQCWDADAESIPDCLSPIIFGEATRQADLIVVDQKGLLTNLGPYPTPRLIRAGERNGYPDAESGLPGICLYRSDNPAVDRYRTTEAPVRYGNGAGELGAGEGIEAVDQVVASVLGGVVGGFFVLIAVVMQFRRQNKAALRALMSEVADNKEVAADIMAHLPVVTTTFEAGHADPGWFKHSIWDSQLPYAVQALDDATLLLTRRAYALLDAVPGMLIPQGVYHPPGTSRYARGAWIDDHLKKISIGFQDADRALDNSRQRAATTSGSLGWTYEKYRTARGRIERAVQVVTRRQAGKILDFIAYLIPIIAAMYWFPRTMDEIGPMPWGFILTLAAAVIIVIVAEFLKD